MSSPLSERVRNCRDAHSTRCVSRDASLHPLPAGYSFLNEIQSPLAMVTAEAEMSLAYVPRNCRRKQACIPRQLSGRSLARQRAAERGAGLRGRAEANAHLVAECEEAKVHILADVAIAPGQGAAETLIILFWTILSVLPRAHCTCRHISVSLLFICPYFHVLAFHIAVKVLDVLFNFLH